MTTQVSDAMRVTTSLDATKLTGNLPAISGASLTGVVGKIVQYVYNVDSAWAVSSDTNGIDNNDTIPQVATDGDLFMSQAITPVSTSNILVVEGILFFSPASAGRLMTAYVTQDSGTAALSCQLNSGHDTANAAIQIYIKHTQVAGTESSTTFKIYGGSNFSGVTTFNGFAGASQYGGTIASTMSITEVQV